MQLKAWFVAFKSLFQGSTRVSISLTSSRPQESNAPSGINIYWALTMCQAFYRYFMFICSLVPFNIWKAYVLHQIKNHRCSLASLPIKCSRAWPNIRMSAKDFNERFWECDSRGTINSHEDLEAEPGLGLTLGSVPFILLLNESSLIILLLQWLKVLSISPFLA